MGTDLNKYIITKQDLNNSYHDLDFDSFTDRFLAFIEEEKTKGNYLLSQTSIKNLERKVKKGIYTNITILIVLGMFCLVLGLYQFLFTKPLIGVNLYTHFPLINNGSIEIIGSITLFIGCLYSYRRRNSVVERLVKSKLIDDLKELYRNKSMAFNSSSKKRKRFKKSYKVGKK